MSTLYRGDFEGGWIGIYTNDAEENIVAHVLSEDVGEDRVHDYANLFAAAPDLLAALRMVRDELCMGGDWESAKRIADAAIARATEK